MRDFAETVSSPRLREELLEALSGRRPFRRFKDVLADYPKAEQAWFAFEEHAHREWLRSWPHSLRINPVEPPKPPAQPPL